MSLAETIEAFKKGFLAQVPEEVQALMGQDIASLQANKLAENAVKSGDSLLDATFKDPQGNDVALSSFLGKGPLVVSFYRGGWCPYCNLELAALQSVLPAIKAAGAELIAITPELPDQSLTTADKNALTFPVLSDVNAEYARKLGLVHTLPEVLRPIYASFGIDVEKHNGSGQFDMPLAATYVIDPTGSIVFDFIDADYTKRMEPADILSALQKMTANA